jgi:hypothetical protein
LGYATGLDWIASTGAPGEVGFGIRSDVGKHINEEGRSSASIKFLNRHRTKRPPEGGPSTDFVQAKRNVGVLFRRYA